MSPGTSILDGSDGTTDPTATARGWPASSPLRPTTAERHRGRRLRGRAGHAGHGAQRDGEGQDSDVIAGVIWAADHGADVILMAFSNPGFSPTCRTRSTTRGRSGVVLVAAAGNDGVATPTFPAGDRGVMGVAATDANDALAYFSNDGQAVFIAAPASTSRRPTSATPTTVSGTSTSAAIVAGAAAFMKAVDPTLTNGIIVGRLARNADPAGTQSQTGNGRINWRARSADTATESPAGRRAPVGSGGPFVGPYRAAATRLASITVGAQVGALTYGTGGSVTFAVTVNGNGNGKLISIAVSGLPTGATFSPTSFPRAATATRAKPRVRLHAHRHHDKPNARHDQQLLPLQSRAMATTPCRTPAL